MGLRQRRAGKKARRRVAPRSRFQRWLFRWGWIFPVAALLLGGAILVITYAFASIPLPRDIDLESSAEVYDVRGRQIGTFTGKERRFLIDPETLPEYVGQAVIAAEDRDFYEHNGVSIRGIARAAWANVTGGEIQQGGSTITQQYIKNAVLHDPERTVSRKLKEAILAIKLERRYSKNSILGFYINTIYLGRGAFGFEAAARTYFDTHAHKLTLAQAAYLASIIPSPESYQPDDNPKSARARRNRVLQAMENLGYIAPAERVRASRGKVKVAPAGLDSLRRQRAAYFMEWIRKDFLEEDFGNDLYTGGLSIHTSLDLRMQELAEQAVAEKLTDPTEPQAALVSMTPDGQVRAFVGGRDFTSVAKARGFNFASDNRRQAGSAFKPFTLLAAVEEGISPQSRFSGSSQVTIRDPLCETNGEPWQPQNYGGSSFGTITLDQATTNSVNTVYAQLASKVGPDKIARTVRRFGFDRPVEPRCSLALGTKDVSPVQMARAYAGFTARGLLPPVTPVRYVEDADGNCLKEYIPTRHDCEEEYGDDDGPVRATKTNPADVLNQTMTHVVQGGTATAANIGREVAGKTGTTQENKDAWFAGSIPQLTTVVWMGYPCETPHGGGGCKKNKQVTEKISPLMRYCSDPVLCRPVQGIEVTGGSFPAQMWAAYMEPATEALEVEKFPIPEDVPDKIINSPPPVYHPPPSPSETPKPSASATVKPTPKPSPPPPPPPPPPPSPTDPVPSPTRRAGDPGAEP